MNFLLIAYYYPPMNNGGIQRPLKMKKYLEKAGHKVTVITVGFGFDEIVFQEDLIRVSAKRLTKSNFKHIPQRIMTRIKYPLAIKRYPEDFWKTKVEILSERIVEKYRPQMVISTYPPLENLELGTIISEKYGLPLISDFRDGLLFEPLESPVSNDYVKSHLALVERKTVGLSSLITTVSEPITEYFRKTYNDKKVVTIMNGFDPDDFKDLPKEELDSSKFNMTFTGRMSLSSSKTKSHVFFKTIEELSSEDNGFRENVCINMVGNFSKKEKASMRRLQELDVLKIHGLLDRKVALRYQLSSNLLILITGTDRKSVVTGKIFEYLYARKPILALTHDTEAGKIISELKHGWVVHPEDKNKIKRLVKKIVKSKEIYNTTEFSTKKLEKYSMENQINKLSEAMAYI